MGHNKYCVLVDENFFSSVEKYLTVAFLIIWQVRNFNYLYIMPHKVISNHILKWRTDFCVKNTPNLEEY